MPVKCPRCRKTFVWQDVLSDNENKKHRRARRPVPSVEKVRRGLEKQEEKQKRLIEGARQRKEEKEKELREIRWHCGQCGKGLCELDFQEGTGLYDDRMERAYCRDHSPAWLLRSHTRVRPAARTETPQSPLRAKTAQPYRTHEPPRYDKDRAQSSLRWIAPAIIIAAVIIIGGYIGYVEYNKYKLRQNAEKFLDSFQRGYNEGEAAAQRLKKIPPNERCRNCNGWGRLICPNCMGDGCASCNEQGWIDCPACEGTGRKQ